MGTPLATVAALNAVRFSSLPEDKWSFVLPRFRSNQVWSRGERGRFHLILPDRAHLSSIFLLWIKKMIEKLLKIPSYQTTVCQG
eukprot:Gb_27691 [translate_table: standard]